MKNFEYYTPTKVVFGKGTENEVGKLILQETKDACVLVHYGSGSVKLTGLLDRICKSLDDAGIKYVTLGGVVPNPRLSKVYEGIELCKKEGINFILAVGGGSVIDSSKAIGYGVANEGDVWDFYDYKRVPEACLPIATVLTIAAAGSEMSDSSVITKEEGWIKRGVSADCSRCRFAIMNPELTMTLPDYQTSSGEVDIIMHTLERYLGQGKNMNITDEISEGLIRTVIKNAKILVKDPSNYDARAEIMWAGSLSHNGLTGCGVESMDWASHQLEHELGGMFDVAHGAGLAAVWPTWARYVVDANPARFAQLADKVFGISDKGSDMANALAGIDAMEQVFRDINMPVTLTELGLKDLTDEQIDELAEKCSFGQTRTIGGVKALNKADMINIYTKAR